MNGISKRKSYTFFLESFKKRISLLLVSLFLVSPLFLVNASKSIAKNKIDAEIESVLNKLADKKWTVRAQAIKGITEKQYKNLRIHSSFHKMFRDQNWIVRYFAIKKISTLDPKNAEVISQLQKSLKDQQTNRYVIHAIRDFTIKSGKPALPIVFEMLKSHDSTVRYSAAKALGKLGPQAGDMFDFIIEMLRDPNPYVQGEIARSLAMMEISNKQNLEKLFHCFDHKNSDRWGSFISQAISNSPKANIPLLTATFRNGSNENTQKGLLKVFSFMGIKALPAIPCIIQVIDRRNSPYIMDNFADCACKAILSMGEKAVPHLLSYFSNNSSLHVKLFVLHTLIDFVPKASQALPLLIKLVNDSNENIAELAVKALGKISTKENNQGVVSLLFKRFQSKGAGIRKEVLYSLNELVREKEKLIPLLESALSDENDDVRGAAISVLADLGMAPANKKFMLPFLLNQIKKNEKFYQNNAIQILKGMEEEVKSYPAVLPYLLQVLEDKNKELKLDVIGIIGSIGPKAKRATPHLIKELTSKDRWLNALVIDALGRLKDERALPLLMKFLKGNTPGIRYRNASYALFTSGNISVPYLRKALKSKDILLKIRSLKLLLRLKSIGPSETIAMMKNIQQEAPKEIPEIAHYLMNLEPPLEIKVKMIPYLINSFRCQEKDTREMAIQEISRVGKEAISLLINLYKNQKEKREVLYCALRSLLRISEKFPGQFVAHLPFLGSTLLETSRKGDIFWLSLLLGNIGPPAIETLPDIVRLNKNVNKWSQPFLDRCVYNLLKSVHE